MATMTVLNSVGGTETVEKPMSVENNALLTAIAASVDGLEALIAATNTALSAVNGSVDGLEALLGTGNTSLATIATNASSTAPSPVEVGPFTIKNIAASQTNAVVGATGAVGDYLSHIIIQPASTSPGAVTIYDGSTGGTNTTIYSFPGGSSSLSNLAPLVLALPAKAVNAGWRVTTGANVAVTLVGSFT